MERAPRRVCHGDATPSPSARREGSGGAPNSMIKLERKLLPTMIQQRVGKAASHES